MSLFQRLGGADAINAVVDKFYEIMLKDSRVSHYFATIDMQKQSCRQKQFITLVTGGPNIYEGTDMKTAHCKLSIGHMEYDATWENLQSALNFFNVPEREINELKQIFYSVQSQIVNRVDQATEIKNSQDHKHETQQQSEKSLYERLGGHSAVSSVVSKFYQIMLKDQRVNFYFANTDMKKQMESQTEFISMVTGGSNNYNGKDMKTAHCPYKISNLEFDATWQNLEKSLYYFKVDKNLIDELKEIFYSVEEDIVRQRVQCEAKNVQQDGVKQNSATLSSLRPTVQNVIPVTSKSEVTKSSHSKYEDVSSITRCPHMSSKLKQNFQTNHKFSQEEKRILRQQVMSKQIEEKAIKKLSNCPYQRTYY